MNALETPMEKSPVVLKPVLLDVRRKPWSVHSSTDGYWMKAESVDGKSDLMRQVIEENKDRRFDMVFSANMIHISPYECTEGLFRGSGEVLCPGGRLIVYGPFKIGERQSVV